MANWKDTLGAWAEGIEEQWDGLRATLAKKLQLNDPVQVITYRTYGTPRRIYIKGRVLEDKGIAAANDKDTVWNNLLNMYKRFESDEVRGAVLKAQLPDEAHEVTTDSEGYFVLDLNPLTPLIRESLWHPVPLQLLHAPLPFEKGMQVKAEVMIPPPDAEYGIISDIDDTIVKTTATDLLAMSRTTFLNNAKTRLPFAGVSEFYKALQLGRNGKRNNPFFYVSSSPWNLYDLLKDFLDLNSIPAGPLLLRDFGSNKKPKGDPHMSHKFKEICQIFEAYPHLHFVLVGDSGQEDPAIYREVTKQYPGRVLAVYIRDVLLPERKKVAIEIAQSFTEYKTEMLIVEKGIVAFAVAAQL